MATDPTYIGETRALFRMGLSNALNTMRRRKALKHIKIAARALSAEADSVPIMALAEVANAIGRQALYDAEQYHAAIQQRANELKKANDG